MRLIRILIAVRLMRLANRCLDAAVAIDPVLREARTDRLKTSGLLPRR